MSQAHRAKPNPRRRQTVAAAIIVAVVGALTVSGVAYGANAELCGADGAHCVGVLDSRAAPAEDYRIEIVPLAAEGDLVVTNRAASGVRTVGIVGFLDGDVANGRQTFEPAAESTSTVDLDLWGSDDVRVPGAPRDASYVVVRLAEDARSAGEAMTAGVADRGETPNGLRVELRPTAEPFTADDLLAALRRLATSMGEDEPVMKDARALWRQIDRTTPRTVDPDPVAPAPPTIAPTEAPPAPVEAAAPPVSTESGGEGAPQGDLAEWRQLLVEDFGRDAALGSFASRYPGFASYDGSLDTSAREGRPQGQAGLYSSSTTTSVHDSLLDCNLHTRGATPQVCALTPTLDGGWWEGQMYGRYSVRFKTDFVPGYKIAWLLWPSSDNWNDGEIDFPETELDGTIAGASHNVFGSPQENAFLIDTGQNTQSWHTATIEWRPGSLTFILDGQSWTTTDPAALPTKPMRWTLQTETHLAAAAPAPEVSGHVYIDWIAAYAYAG